MGERNNRGYVLCMAFAAKRKQGARETIVTLTNYVFFLFSGITYSGQAGPSYSFLWIRCTYST